MTYEFTDGNKTNTLTNSIIDTYLNKCQACRKGRIRIILRDPNTDEQTGLCHTCAIGIHPEYKNHAM